MQEIYAMGPLMSLKRLLALALATLVIAATPIANASAGTTQYEYDAQGRLVRAIYSNGNVVTYTYDAAGNRTAKVVTGGA